LAFLSFFEQGVQDLMAVTAIIAIQLAVKYLFVTQVEYFLPRR